jgi:hypothetical protein
MDNHWQKEGFSRFFVDLVFDILPIFRYIQIEPYL